MTMLSLFPLLELPWPEQREDHKHKLHQKQCLPQLWKMSSRRPIIWTQNSLRRSALETSWYQVLQLPKQEWPSYSLTFHILLLCILLIDSAPLDWLPLLPLPIKSDQDKLILAWVVESNPCLCSIWWEAWTQEKFPKEYSNIRKLKSALCLWESPLRMLSKSMELPDNSRIKWLLRAIKKPLMLKSKDGHKQKSPLMRPHLLIRRATRRLWRSTEMMELDHKLPLPVSENWSPLSRRVDHALQETPVRSLMELPLFFLLEEMLPWKWVSQSRVECLASAPLVCHQRLWELDQQSQFHRPLSKLVLLLKILAYGKLMRPSPVKPPTALRNSVSQGKSLTEEEELLLLDIHSVWPVLEWYAPFSPSSREPMINMESFPCVSELEWELLVYSRENDLWL